MNEKITYSDALFELSLSQQLCAEIKAVAMDCFTAGEIGTFARSWPA